MYEILQGDPTPSQRDRLLGPKYRRAWRVKSTPAGAAAVAASLWSCEDSPHRYPHLATAEVDVSALPQGYLDPRSPTPEFWHETCRQLHVGRPAWSATTPLDVGDSAVLSNVFQDSHMREQSTRREIVIYDIPYTA
ncbi:hypothetical protein J6590_008050 [Homalodisca vitripennis]|nr:hypothetical protein J6590_008050 [Homalodisca vitripennis]